MDVRVWADSSVTSLPDVIANVSLVNNPGSPSSDIDFKPFPTPERRWMRLSALCLCM
jgi:hypothetical protein